MILWSLRGQYTQDESVVEYLSYESKTTSLETKNESQGLYARL